jgi:hypothetical protein
MKPGGESCFALVIGSRPGTIGAVMPSAFARRAWSK